MESAASSAGTDLLYEGRPSWRAQLVGHVFAALVALAGLVGAIIVPMTWTDVGWPVAGGGAGALVLFALIRLFILWVRRQRHVRISTRSIDIQSGVIGRRIDTIPLWKIRDLTYEQTVLDRLLGISRIYAATKDVTSPLLQLWGLPADRELFLRLKEAIEIARQGRNVIGVME